MHNPKNNIICQHVTAVQNEADVSGSPQDSIFGRIITGVAIARVPRDITRDTLTLYFGCVAHARGKGGAGYVQKTGNGAAQIEALQRSGAKIYAGSMLATDVCSTDDAPVTLFTSAAAAAHKQLTSPVMCIVALAAVMGLITRLNLTQKLA